MNTDQTTRRIAEANDIARTTGVLTVALTLKTAERFRREEGVPASQILRRVTRHEFPENTASPQHDFSHLVCGGIEVWWRMVPLHGADPCDPNTPRALVLFMPEEYPDVERRIRG